MVQKVNCLVMVNFLTELDDHGTVRDYRVLSGEFQDRLEW